MAGVRCADLQARPREFLEFTSVTLDEFQQLVPPFEAAFHAHMAAWRMDGKPRTARRLTVYQHCPLPPPAERLLFILTYLQPYALQVVQGRLFGMVQGKAKQWLHGLLPVLLAALRPLGEAPGRSLTALAQRLGVSAADAATVGVPRAEAPAPVVAVPAAAPASPLVPMTGPNDAASAPKTLLNRKRVRAASKRPIRSKMCCWSMPGASSSFSVTPTVAVCMLCAWRRPPPTRSRPGVGGCRSWASCRSRCPKWRSACRRRSPAVRSGP
jgi:hypothetical protein